MSADPGLRGAALLEALESGELRVASSEADGSWTVHTWVKEAILDLFRSSQVVQMGNELDRAAYASLDLHSAPFRDKDLLSVRRFTKREGVRLVPGGSAVRRGAFLGEGVVCMPPMYVNIGAYVGAGVHLSAAAQIGGVLEPPGARPVIVEDGAFIGGNTGIYEGVLVRERAVIAAGLVLTATTRVHDLVQERELTGTREAPLEVPAGAVLVPGTRPAGGEWAAQHGLAVACALIVKYRDASTDAATALEGALR